MFNKLNINLISRTSKQSLPFKFLTILDNTCVPSIIFYDFFTRKILSSNYYRYSQMAHRSLNAFSSEHFRPKAYCHFKGKVRRNHVMGVDTRDLIVLCSGWFSSIAG